MIDVMIDDLNMKQKLLNKKNSKLLKNATEKLYNDNNSSSLNLYKNHLSDRVDSELVQDLVYNNQIRESYLNFIKKRHDDYKKSLIKRIPIMKFKDAQKIQADEAICVCVICNNGDYEDKDLIVYCSRCELTVHQSCYGITDIPNEDWLCETCRKLNLGNADSLECIICPIKGGAMKETQIKKTNSFYTSIDKLRKVNNKLNNHKCEENSFNFQKKFRPKISNYNNLNDSSLILEKLESPIKDNILNTSPFNKTIISSGTTNSNITNTTICSENDENHNISQYTFVNNNINKYQVPQFKVVKENSFDPKTKKIKKSHIESTVNSEFAWIHVACALWIPEIEFSNFEKKEEVKNIEKIPKERFKEKCSICKLCNYGPTIKCTESTCFTKFHVECARINNYFLEIVDINGIVISINNI